MKTSRIVAIAALIGIAAVHLNLYAREAYKHIPTIGPLFLFNVIFAVVLAVVFALRAQWILAAIGVAFSLGTLAGYVYTLVGTLFKFHEPKVSYSGALAILFEVVATAAFIVWAASDRGLKRNLAR